MGTGFVVDAQGVIATNYHVINEGRKFTIKLSSGKQLTPLSVMASDRNRDLALIKVAVDGEPLPALEIADKKTDQGDRVSAFGNPLGFQNSFVDGIVSAVREVEGRELIQLAMAIEPGNSGGPLVDRQGRVIGIINMKSVIDENLAFAIPIDQLQPLQDKPNPVAIDRWVRLGNIDAERWQPLMGATWEESGGVVTARGSGKGFGGRSLCLATQPPPKRPFEVAVTVKLNDESGAAGIAYCSDGKDKHYGFYPSNGRLRLTCFKGATVYSWQVLKEVESPHYVPDQWNRLRLRFAEDEVQCFVNGQLVITTNDRQLTGGKIGLCKFRDTNPDFKQFQVGEDLRPKPLSADAQRWLADLDARKIEANDIADHEVLELSTSPDMASRELMRRALKLESEAEQARRLAADIQNAGTLNQLKQLFDEKAAADAEDRLLQATLLIARLDNPEIDIDFYKQRVSAMVSEIQSSLDKDANDAAKRQALRDYLFKENGFHGARSEYYHPANSHFNRVIDDREGLPITLSILYMQLGRQLGLKIDGVGLPGHFVVRHNDEDGTTEMVDAFESGEVVSDEVAAQQVRQRTGRPISESDLAAQDDQQIVTRVLSNLMSIATRNEDLESMLRYIEAMVAINSEAVEYRMMRAQLRGMTNRKSRAIEDIDWLLNENPPEIDTDRLHRMRDALQ